MLTGLVLRIRERYHPLFYLRKLSTFRWLSQKLDIPVSIRFDEISHPVSVSLSKNLSWVLSKGRAAEPEERANFQKLTSSLSAKTMFDIGANVGLYGFMFASVVPDRSVVLFEPDPTNAALIRSTISRSNLANRRLVEAAVSDVAGKVTFGVDPLSGATGSLNLEESFISTHHGIRPPVVEVESVPLDQFSSSPETDPDVMKIDAEGAELRIFKGGERLFSRSLPMLFFECDRNQAEIQQFLSGLGYVFFDLVTLKRVAALPHNCVALHAIKHGPLLDSLD
jgi:FkbM family methyltransferase